jgi:dihydrofolate reductase
MSSESVAGLHAQHAEHSTRQEDGPVRKLFSFIVMTLDGYHEGPNQEFDWPNVDDEFDEFSLSQLNDIGLLMFGRATYEGMAAFWPTELAATESPEITEFMNSLPKVVFSNSLTSANWSNTTLAVGDLSETVSQLKEQPGKDIAVFGSSNLTVSLLELNLIDELRVMVHPVVLGAGHSMLAGLTSRVTLELQRTMTFRSGNVLLCYRPVTT